MKKTNLPRILTFYLPQFHETEDNNRWWGKGFTEWEAVKASEAYFPGHQEPRIPLNRNYYDLSQKKTMEWQADLAKQYSIGGFCFYHYYFKDGKKELELPAENLLRWTDIDMPFCFNWAHDSWIRSWSKLNGLVWAEKHETADDGSKNGVLAEQDYGTYEDWARHFEYLLPFFQDSRYIKKDGKPVFLFYKPNNIGPLQKMMECWRKLALEAGLPGLYLIGEHLNAPNSALDAALVHEPRNSMDILNNAGHTVIQNGVRCYEYQEIWETVLDTDPIWEYKTYFCGITGYDDTPRRGNRGESLIRHSPEIFKRNLVRLIQKSCQQKNEFLFLNAWNEWGEGMYLEPDEKDGFRYLESVRDAIGEVVANSEPEGEISQIDRMKKRLDILEYEAGKYRQMARILGKWLYLEQENGVNLSCFFQKEQIRHVAVYGMAELGKRLLTQLRKEKMDVPFGIDRSSTGQFGNGCLICRPEDDFPDVDAIIITAYDTSSIEQMLRKKFSGKIYTLEEIMDAVMRNVDGAGSDCTAGR